LHGAYAAADAGDPKAAAAAAGGGIACGAAAALQHAIITHIYMYDRSARYGEVDDASVGTAQLTLSIAHAVCECDDPHQKRTAELRCHTPHSNKMGGCCSKNLPANSVWTGMQKCCLLLVLQSHFPFPF
jgi:hypothetical protein